MKKMEQNLVVSRRLIKPVFFMGMFFIQLSLLGMQPSDSSKHDASHNFASACSTSLSLPSAAAAGISPLMNSAELPRFSRISVLEGLRPFCNWPLDAPVREVKKYDYWPHAGSMDYFLESMLAQSPTIELMNSLEREALPLYTIFKQSNYFTSSIEKSLLVNVVAVHNARYIERVIQKYALALDVRIQNFKRVKEIVRASFDRLEFYDDACKKLFGNGSHESFTILLEHHRRSATYVLGHVQQVLGKKDNFSAGLMELLRADDNKLVSHDVLLQFLQYVTGEFSTAHSEALKEREMLSMAKELMILHSGRDEIGSKIEGMSKLIDLLLQSMHDALCRYSELMHELEAKVSAKTYDAQSNDETLINHILRLQQLFTEDSFLIKAAGAIKRCMSNDPKFIGHPSINTMQNVLNRRSDQLEYGEILAESLLRIASSNPEHVFAAFTLRGLLAGVRRDFGDEVYMSEIKFIVRKLIESNGELDLKSSITGSVELDKAQSCQNTLFMAVRRVTEILGRSTNTEKTIKEAQSALTHLIRKLNLHYCYINCDIRELVGKMLQQCIKLPDLKKGSEVKSLIDLMDPHVFESKFNNLLR